MYDMREIKFRAWDEPSQSFVENAMPHKARHFEQPLMQFTGLKDKNGKEIYEGDIVEFEALLDSGKKGRAKVFYQDGSFIANGLMNNRIPLEVIGNIYENNELLKA